MTISPTQFLMEGLYFTAGHETTQRRRRTLVELCLNQALGRYGSGSGALQVPSRANLQKQRLDFPYNTLVGCFQFNKLNTNSL